MTSATSATPYRSRPTRHRSGRHGGRRRIVVWQVRVADRSLSGPPFGGLPPHTHSPATRWRWCHRERGRGPSSFLLLLPRAFPSLHKLGRGRNAQPRGLDPCRAFSDTVRSPDPSGPPNTVLIPEGN